MAGQHTPGPWYWFSRTINAPGEPRVEVQETEGMKFMVGANGQGFAHTVGLSGGVDVANAHLIAAAPELLEALKHVVAAERAFIEDTNGAWDDEVGRAVIAAEAVIRKAEGRSHG